MASIRKTSGGKYQIRWTRLDGVETSYTCPDAKTAGPIKREIEQCLAGGKEWVPPKARRVAGLKDIAAEYIVALRRRSRPETARRHGTALDVFLRYLEEKHPRRPLTAAMLTRPLLEDFYAWLQRPETGLHGKARGVETVRKLVEVVQLMWRWADNSDRWPEQIPRPREIEMQRGLPQQVVSPTFEEMAACVLACLGWQRMLTAFLYYSGLRVGETMLLRWRDVDLERAILTIPAEITKTGGRAVPLHPALVETLRGWGAGAPEDYVIPSTRQQGQRHRQARSRDIGRAWERAGVRRAVWFRRPDHAFRRGFKTGLLKLGAHADAVDFLQGHVGGGARARYIDAWQALPLRETIAKVPVLPAQKGPSGGEGDET